MSVRRDTNNRYTLVRSCQICGKTFSTTADTPFMRQMTNVDGKKQKTCYFCSETCKKASYKHLFDGKADIRRAEREAKRDVSAKNRRYYEAHAEELREKQRRYYEAHRDECNEAARYNRRKKKLLGVENRAVI